MLSKTNSPLIGSFEEERAHLEWFVEQMRAIIRSSQFEKDHDFLKQLSNIFRDQELRIKSLRALHFCDWLMLHTNRELKNLERMMDDRHYEEGLL